MQKVSDRGLCADCSWRVYGRRLVKRRYLVQLEPRRLVLLSFVLSQLFSQETGAFADRYFIEPVDAEIGGDIVPVQIKCGHDPEIAGDLYKKCQDQEYGKGLFQIAVKLVFKLLF